ESAVKRLGPVSGVVPGQSVSDDAVVTPTPPVQNTKIPSGTRLQNVLIGSGTSFGEGVVLGPNVRFTPDALIPAGLVLTHALTKLPWIGANYVEAVDLSVDVVASD